MADLKFIVLQGPNLNRLGVRRPEKYGLTTLPEITESISNHAASLGVRVVQRQSNHEGEIVDAIRSLRGDIIIVARARDAEHARDLYKQKVSDAVPETIEASLQLSEATLVGLGVPTGPVIASIHEKRDEFREQLQGAAGRPTRGLRASQKKLSP